jgi:glyoxylase-like metal-dependent hydrolase (beta-lactamase superfamily II)
MRAARLPDSLHVIERGWLSSNNILGFDADSATLIDTGYASQAAQTLSLVNSALVGRRSGANPARLTRIINTHSHADHMGGNAALHAHYRCPITIPEGIAQAVTQWDESALLLSPLGQRSTRFTHHATMAAGEAFRFGELDWHALAAPGHDPHALIFHCPAHDLLISGDALWQDGFGIVFGELLGDLLSDPNALPAARATLALIDTLAAHTVIPGHGSVFTDVTDALARARARLERFENHRPHLARNALKALLTFNLLDHARLRADTLGEYIASIPVFAQLATQLDLAPDIDPVDWVIDALLRVRAITLKDGWLVPTMAA